MPRVFSVNNFNGGLDTRKTELTAPGGTLRVLDNCMVNSGGEIQKRLAFATVAQINMATNPKPYVFGQAGVLHVFNVMVMPGINPGTCPVPIVGHMLAAAPEQISAITDCEAYDGKFYVSGVGVSGTTYVWYDGAILHEADNSYSHGTFSRTYKSKMYRIDGKYLRFSGVNNPAINDPSNATYPGAGFINLSINDPDGEVLQGMEIYYGSMAVAARLLTQMWTLDPDPSLDTIGQVLRIGTVAPKSMLQFGTGDVLFLSDSGVRSLKAMNINLAAAVSDVGSAIDEILKAVMRTVSATVVSNAKAIVQPIQGRYWLFLNGVIYVLSYYPSANITAWSTFGQVSGLGFNLLELIIVEQNVYVLDDQGNIRLYGGTDGQTYDNCTVTIVTPHMQATGSTENKRISAVDVMCQGAWQISIGMLPNKTSLYEVVANLQDNTFGLQSIPFAGYGTHIGIQMINSAPGPALLAAIHLNVQEGFTKGGPS